MDQINAYIDQHVERAVSLLERLCRQPSISAQGIGLPEMAELLAAAMREYGLQADVLPVAGGPPLVLAELRGRSSHTVLLYNHYDVQPVDPLDQWLSPPFTPTRRDGKLFARGVSDNKGDLAVRLEAIAALRDVSGDLPLTVKFIVEGEEESGSPHFPAAVAAYRQRLAADVCLSEASGLSASGTAPIVLGVKGLVYVELSTQSARLDAHSAYAPVVPNAAWRLVQALATLRDANGRVALPGFYERVRPLSPQEVAAIQQMPDTSDMLRASLGLPAFIDGLQGYAWQERLLNAPTCNLCGLEAGYTGPGLKTVLPAQARAKIDFRLVPEQRPEEVVAQLRAHLDSLGFADVAITVIAAHERATRTSLTDPWVQTTIAAASEFFGRRPDVEINNPGTAPMYVLVDEVSPSLFFAPGGPGYYGSQIHAPNEHIRLADLPNAIKMTALLLTRFGEV